MVLANELFDISHKTGNKFIVIIDEAEAFQSSVQGYIILHLTFSKILFKVFSLESVMIPIIGGDDGAERRLEEQSFSFRKELR